MAKLTAGDRVAYAAKFLKDTGQFTGSAGQRRGTFVGYDRTAPDFARVKWDDFNVAYAAEQWGADYAADCVARGTMVHARNIAKVGSAGFAANDLYGRRQRKT